MTLYQWLCVLGIPTVVATVINLMFAQAKRHKGDLESVKLGIQALLRAQMIDDWNKYKDKGYAPIYAKQNFENCWKQYHALGANGVMDDLHEKFLNLPLGNKAQE